MVLAPIDRGMSTLRTVIIHTINLILCLRFRQVRVMNAGLILKLRIHCERHLMKKSVRNWLVGSFMSCPGRLVRMKERDLPDQ